MEVYTGRLFGLKYKLVRCLKLVVSESLSVHTDEPTLMKRELVGFGVDRHQ